MFSTVYSGGILGVRSYLARVEVDMAKALPAFDMVGKLSKEVHEAKERVKVALKNSGIEVPPVHITVNISPADIRKTGTSYDLPIAVGIIAALGFITDLKLQKTFIIGELGLDGNVVPINGVLPMVMEAKRKRKKLCIVPKENAKEASYVDGIEVVGVETLAEAIECINNKEIREGNIYKHTREDDEVIQEEDFADIVGQDACKRATLIAASGFHHICISGPPGTGKSMIAKRISGIMPQMTLEESLEVSSIYSVAGELDCKKGLITKRPFQAPHHSCTKNALTGGGMELRPGIMSLSHKGILFLDELPEFQRECIEVLREPLEDKKVRIARVYGTYDYPAQFMLVAAMNPCPCGYFPDKNKCKCNDSEILKYQNKISGPIKDRLDIFVTSRRVAMDEIDSNIKTISSKEMREQLLKARAVQKKRYAGSRIEFNSQINAKNINKYCLMDEEAKKYLNKAYDAMELSVRAYHKILKVARTIADLEGSELIKKEHVMEAVCYRS